MSGIIENPYTPKNKKDIRKQGAARLATSGTRLRIWCSVTAVIDQKQEQTQKCRTFVAPLEPYWSAPALCSNSGFVLPMVESGLFKKNLD